MTARWATGPRMGQPVMRRAAPVMHSKSPLLATETMTNRAAVTKLQQISTAC